jgi:hypothetical protein
MSFFRRAAGLLPPAQQVDAEIGDTIIHLRELLRTAETTGGHFLPSARLARTMLKAIYWL